MKLFYFLMLVVFTTNSFSQINDSLRDNLLFDIDKKDIPDFRTADAYFNALEYQLALPIYDKLYVKYKNLYLGYLLGSCCAFETHNYYRAAALITNASKIKPYLHDYSFYYGKSLAVTEKDKLAIAEYEEYLKNPLPEKIKTFVLHEIDNCKNNLSTKDRVTAIKIKNSGDKINTNQNEYSPVFPGDESFMVYTYRGEKSVGGKQSLPGKKSEKGIYFEDIYISYKDASGVFQRGMPMTELNSKTHESASYITHDGQKIYLYKNINGSGEIYVSNKLANKWSKPTRLNGICSNNWEGSCCFSADEKTIYFSSDRPGGLGGRDIWKATLQANEQFEKPINLGAPINTSSDEDSPFITFDGELFYFSSNDGHRSIGGYDIFKSEIKNNNFGNPENIGKPLNTIQDDKYLVISPDGKKAYYSSEHLDGLGQQDIYEIDRAKFEKQVALILVNGIVTFEGKPVAAKITAESTINKDYYSGQYNSILPNGDYFISLPGQSSYELTFEYKNIKTKKIISAPLIDSLVKLTLNIEITAEDTLIASLVAKPIDSISVNQDITPTEFLQKYADTKFDSTVFKIQIGAYKMAENFNYARLIGQPVLNKYKGSDKITRFTVGEYDTFGKASVALINVVKLVVDDAFIIAVKNNVRISLKDLLKGK